MNRLAALIGVLLLPPACTSSGADDAGAAPPPPRFEAVRPAEELGTLEGPARVLPGPSAQSVVTPPLRGTVSRIRVREGDVVDAGTALIDLVMPELLQAAGAYEGARVRLSAWTERHQQLEKLRAEGLARSFDVSEAAARVAEARADLQAARAVLLSAGVRESEVGALLAGSGALGLKAPVSGVVNHVAASLGENREPNAGPLVFISSGGPVRVEARFSRPAPEGDFELIVPAGRVPLRVLARAPIADPKDGSFLAWFEPAADASLAAGTLGRVVLKASGAPTVFRVPALALRREGQQARVLTRRGQIDVEVRRCEAEECLVQGPLRGGDEVAVEPAP